MNKFSAGALIPPSHLPDINRAQFKSYCRKMKFSFKSKFDDASRGYKKVNIIFFDFFYGAASPAATHYGLI
jgi:hypothetical protein